MIQMLQNVLIKVFLGIDSFNKEYPTKNGMIFFLHIVVELI